ncbi:MAG: hypothetical protein PHP15_11110, partial [Bacteroidales bacterium]|nr:hypothetical protein [Bacteroidales bacterium]
MFHISIGMLHFIWDVILSVETRAITSLIISSLEWGKVRGKACGWGTGLPGCGCGFRWTAGGSENKWPGSFGSGAFVADTWTAFTPVSSIMRRTFRGFTP